MILELNLYTSCKLFHKEKEENLYLFANAKKLMQTTIEYFFASKRGGCTSVTRRRDYSSFSRTRIHINKPGRGKVTLKATGMQFRRTSASHT